MLPIPIPFEVWILFYCEEKVAVTDTKIPTYEDVIIPDPSFELCDMMSFECVRPNPFQEEKLPILDNQSTVEIVSQSFSEAIQTMELSSSFANLLKVYMFNFSHIAIEM